MSDRNFGGVIWTNHAISRLGERGISQGNAWAAFRRPDKSKYAAVKGGWVFYKTYKDTKIEVVAKQNEKKQWVILSVWSSKVFRNETKPTPLWKLVFKQLFGR